MKLNEDTKVRSDTATRTCRYRYNSYDEDTIYNE